MKPIRAVVVEDNDRARAHLLAMLRDQPDVAVVGESDNGTDAITLIRELAPDLVFLDIQMPGENGIAVIQAVGPQSVPALIFVTAHDQYAVRAFEAEAFDYLLKPFGRARFDRTMSRVRRHLQTTSDARATRTLLDLVHTVTPTASEKIKIKAGASQSYVAVDDIEYVEAQGNYVVYSTRTQQFTSRDGLTRVAAHLGSRFVRTHRSYLVNSRHVKETRAVRGGHYEVVLATGRRVPVSRVFHAAVEAALLGRGRQAP